MPSKNFSATITLKIAIAILPALVLGVAAVPVGAFRGAWGGRAGPPWAARGGGGAPVPDAGADGAAGAPEGPATGAGAELHTSAEAGAVAPAGGVVAGVADAVAECATDRRGWPSISGESVAGSKSPPTHCRPSQ